MSCRAHVAVVSRPLSRVSARRIGYLALATVIVGASLVGAWGIKRHWPARMARQAVQVTDEGVRSWRQGRLHTAEIEFESARAMDPLSLRPALLHARLLFQRGDRKGGTEIFQRQLQERRGAERELALVTYHDALVAAGCWAERARLSVGELARAGESPILLAAAVESVRLADWRLKDFQAVATETRLLEPSASLLRAQCALNAGDAFQARRELAKTGPISPLASLIKCRLFLRASDPVAARSALNEVTAELDDFHVQLGMLALAADEPELARRAARALCADPRLNDTGGAVLEAMLAELFAHPDPRIAEALSERFASHADQVEAPLVSALWLYCSLSSSDRAAAIWADQLGRRFSTWPINLQGRKLDQQVALFAINSLPLTRQVIDGIIAAIPAPLAEAKS